LQVQKVYVFLCCKNDEKKRSFFFVIFTSTK